jgi:hypothetical protein
MPTSPSDPNIVHADPSKSFFIDMLTRDIGVTDCILDLIDNAIDRAVERSQVKVMNRLEQGQLESQIRGAEIRIEYSTTQFAMYDSSQCTIPVEELVFRKRAKTSFD